MMSGAESDFLCFLVIASCKVHVGDIFFKKEHRPKTTAEFKTNNVYKSYICEL